MKKTILILVAMLMATTAYNQTSRRSANSNTDAREGQSRSTYTRPGNSSSRTTTARSNRNATRTATITANSNVNQDRNRTTRTRTTTVTSNRTHNPRVVKDRNTHYNHRDRNNVNRYNHRSTSTRTVYASSPSSRHYKGHHKTTYIYHTPPREKSYRVKHYHYRTPVYVDIVWTRDMHRHYIKMYPDYRFRHYDYGHRINTISAYRADYYIGDVQTVYGKVTEVFYARETDEYFLYIGPHYPYQDFTVVIPGHIARKYSHRPGYYFRQQHVNVTGLITAFEGKPEIVVKRRFQLNVY